MQEFLILSGVLLLASFVQGATGFGLGLVAVALLSLVFGPRVAVPLSMCFGFSITLPLVLHMRKAIQLRDGLYLALAAFPGAYVGSMLLKAVAAEYILLAMGLLLVFSSLYFLFSRPFHICIEKFWLRLGFHSFVGAVAGFLGATTGGPGPPVVLWLSAQPWRAEQVKATLSFFFMLQGFGTLLLFAFGGFFSRQMLGYVALAAPGFLLGTALGILAFDFLQQKQWNYRRWVHGLLVLVGARLLWSGLRFVWGA